MQLKFKLLLLILLTFTTTISYAEWGTLAPLKTPKGKDLLSDILCRSPQSWSDSDLSTTAHENIHFINSRIRKEAGPQYNGFYLLNGRCYIVKEPRNIKLKDIADIIPQERRFDIYQLYMVDQQSGMGGGWNDTPTYIMDECSAYFGGAMVAMELNNMKRAEDSLYRGVELLIYFHYLEQKVHQADITELYSFQKKRLELLYSQLPKQNPKLVRNYNILMSLE